MRRVYQQLFLMQNMSIEESKSFLYTFLKNLIIVSINLIMHKPYNLFYKIFIK